MFEGVGRLCAVRAYRAYCAYCTRTVLNMLFGVRRTDHLYPIQ